MRIVRTLLAFLALAIPATLFGQLRVSISIGPPALPVFRAADLPWRWLSLDSRLLGI